MILISGKFMSTAKMLFLPSLLFLWNQRTSSQLLGVQYGLYYAQLSHVRQVCCRGRSDVHSSIIFRLRLLSRTTYRFFAWSTDQSIFSENRNSIKTAIEIRHYRTNLRAKSTTTNFFYPECSSLRQ